MLIRAMADQHGWLPKIEPCDLLLIAGDVCPIEDHDHDFQTNWLATEYSNWLAEIPAKKIVGIAGNHDFVFEKGYEGPRLPWTYLLDNSTDFEGYKIYGTPWVPNLPTWAFHDDGNRWIDQIPDDVDILMTHGPPNGVGDRVTYGWNVGSTHLTSALAYRIEPKLHVFGHIHEARGVWNAEGERIPWVVSANQALNLDLVDPPTLANVTLKNENYEAKYIPMSFKLSDR